MPGPGDQTLSFKYLEDGTTSNLNKHYADILSTGIYWGGNLTNPSGDIIAIAPFIALVRCSSGELVKVQSATAVNVTVSETTPYAVYTLTWADDETNYGTFSARADDGNFNGNTIYSNEIVFGKAVYSAGVIVSISYSDTTFGLYDSNKDCRVKNTLYAADATIYNDISCNRRVTASVDLVIPPTATITPTPISGSSYFDALTNTLYIYNGTAWKGVLLSL